MTVKGSSFGSAARAFLRSRKARAAAVVLSLIAMLRLTSLVESWVFYFPSREAFTTRAPDEDVWITTPDGLKLHGWFLSAQDAAPGERRPAILHCHGNAGSIDSHHTHSRFLTTRGFHVLIFDYRGYGRSDDARPTRFALKSDALAAWDALASRPDVDTANLGILGVSLGGTFALAVATERPQARAICTVAAFSSWSGVANDHAPFLGKLLIPSGLNARELVTSLKERPYLIVHGDADEVVSARHATILRDAAANNGVPVTFAPISGADHNGVLDTQTTRDTVSQFFSQTLQSSLQPPP